MNHAAFMRSLLIFPLALCLLLAACESEDIKETGISRADAIAVAERHCPQYPMEFAYVDRAEWNPDGRYWLVSLTDRDADHGRVYRVSRHGEILSTHTINHEGDEDDYGPYHHWGYYW